MHPRISVTLAASLAAAAVLCAGCGKGEAAKPGAPAPAAPGAPAGAPNAPASADDALIAKYGKDVLDIPMVRYEWDRNAGDKSVPAELGGPGFTGEGWTTRLEFPMMGSPKAKKGGSMRMYLTDWPATLRQQGEDWNESYNYVVSSLCNESLVGTHPVDLKTIPGLATHWKISDDKQTYTFRINPSARFSDGTEVTADDVVANWTFRMDPKLKFPSNIIVYGKFDKPVAKSKYIVEVHCREDSWRNFMYFGETAILPGREIGIGGEAYLDKYQNAYTANSGPYTVRAEDVKMGQSLTISRRTDWWDAKNPAWVGLNNIDRFVYEVVKDPNLAFEKAKKGDLDLFVVPKAQWWAEEIPKLEAVQRGLLIPKKIYNDAPIGTSGVAINTKKAPLDDLRIRKALQFLYNRPLYIRKLYFNEYEPLTSYEQAGVWANPANKVFPYDPVAAVELLEQAGWKDTNAELYRVKDGRVLQFQIIYSSPLSERYLTIFQEDCKKAGIKLDLKMLTQAERWKTMTQKEYELCDTAWGALVFPNPETSWKSSLADETGNNNVTSFRNAKVDQLLGEYDRAYDVDKRVTAIREIDGIIYGEMPYVLGWYLPSIRFLYWNKYSMPAWGTSRVLDSSDPFWAFFWVDPDKERALEAARADPSKSLPREEADNKFWRAYKAKQLRDAGNKPK